ncbi:GNAT family N-acetyltransferase [Thalassospira povalilytica]|uniref:GNAT family N-acetyltransferase n=1 Tax=Thalassospira povalilytica TaxID=732237 RepID=UPI000DED4D3B|nr:GNAT family N-acetyltransferase [Thalassospira povalilytica]MCC4241248.1 GNAT family N-acetyltransferase [Thalassospira povalilytica]RCK19264.1 acetyltransferase [Thalassospira profundimaris]
MGQTNRTTPPRIITLDADALADRLEAFGAMLHACVHDGASIGFIEPFPISEAVAFWRDRIIPAVAGGKRTLFVALDDDRVVGTVQLDIDTMPNQAHRGDISKLMVHPDCRRRGIARLLMQAAERRAGELGRSLLTLDTRTGDSAETLYASLGFETAGVIPQFARDPFSEKLSATTVMYKRLPISASRAG